MLRISFAITLTLILATAEACSGGGRNYPTPSVTPTQPRHASPRGTLSITSRPTLSPSPTIFPFSEGDPVYSKETLLSAAYGAPARPPDVPISPAYWVNSQLTQQSGAPAQGWVELCANSIESARQLIPSSPIAPEGPGGPIIAEAETDKYFEFELPGFPGPYRNLMRVHKCSYFVPSLDLRSDDFNFGKPSDVQIGNLAGAVTETTAREFAGYDWSHYALSGSTGASWLETRASTGQEVTADVYATSVTFGDTGLCDRVRLDRWRYLFNPRTGDVRLEYRQLAEIEGECHRVSSAH